MNEHEFEVDFSSEPSDAAPPAPEEWRTIFHSYDDFINAPPLTFAISGFLQKDAVTMIAGSSGHGKTLIMLAMTRALLNATALFGHAPFSVPVAAERVIYLIPESSIGPFWHRLKLFQLTKHVASQKLIVRTLSHREPLFGGLNDPRLLEAARGAHVFLDTAVRFLPGDESATKDASLFAQTLFNLQSAGAVTITGAHHAPKSFDKEDYMTLENVLRGSGDIGAMLATCWGIRQVDDSTTRIFVQNVKPRDFQPCEPFIIEGRPHIDECGEFVMVAEPGEAKELKEYREYNKGGKPARPDREQLKERARDLYLNGHYSLSKIALEMRVSRTEVRRWMKELGVLKDQ